MRKYTLLMFVLFSLISTSIAQVSEPTKEETISWLKDKLTKHFKNFAQCNSGWNCYYSIEGVEIQDCEIIYKVIYRWPFSGGTTDKYTYTIPTKGLKISSDGWFYLNYDGIMIEHTSSISSGGRSNKLSETSYTSTLEFNFGINRSGEEDLVNRIQKAIAHLATFCPEKEKEAF